mmetsp:Transcript_99905/g.158096  ORF Transcript_99905/g.158096 Transcript_99905/m.158096 type:complete len:98 (-) Transcript_99905:172-465(-)
MSARCANCLWLCQQSVAMPNARHQERGWSRFFSAPLLSASASTNCSIAILVVGGDGDHCLSMQVSYFLASETNITAKVPSFSCLCLFYEFLARTYLV